VRYSALVYLSRHTNPDTLHPITSFINATFNTGDDVANHNRWSSLRLCWATLGCQNMASYIYQGRFYLGAAKVNADG
jgi:hypothetical protein